MWPHREIGPGALCRVNFPAPSAASLESFPVPRLPFTALLPAGQELAVRVEFVLLAAPMAAGEGQECTNKADIFPWHLPVVPGAAGAAFALSRLWHSPSLGECEGKEFISLLNPEIPPCPGVVV